MTDEVITAKAAVIGRCVLRAREEHAAATDFATDYTHQDAAVLNVQRAYEAAIALAFRLVQLGQLGAPSSARDAFDLLVSAGRLESDHGRALKLMVGFRNTAVHQYGSLDHLVVERVITERLDDLLAFSAIALRSTADRSV